MAATSRCGPTARPCSTARSMPKAGRRAAMAAGSRPRAAAISISARMPATADVATFDTNSATTQTIDPTTIVTALNSTNVSLQAGNNITINNAIDSSGNAGTFNLTMLAGNAIAIHANIKLNGSFIAIAND